MKKSSSGDLECYAAFLRGINVGGRVVKMTDLKKVFESLGLREVKTIGASGNVLFAAPLTDANGLGKRIEGGLQETLGHTISVMARRVEQLRKMVALEPFKEVKVTPETRLYVTFRAKVAQSKKGIPIPFTAPENNFWILKATRSEIFSVVDLARGGTTIDAMEIIEKEFGKNVTTRNWNTIKKLAL